MLSEKVSAACLIARYRKKGVMLSRDYPIETQHYAAGKQPMML